MRTPSSNTKRRNSTALVAARRCNTHFLELISTYGTNSIIFFIRCRPIHPCPKSYSSQGASWLRLMKLIVTRTPLTVAVLMWCLLCKVLVTFFFRFFPSLAGNSSLFLLYTFTVSVLVNKLPMDKVLLILNLLKW